VVVPEQPAGPKACMSAHDHQSGRWSAWGPRREGVGTWASPRMDSGARHRPLLHELDFRPEWIELQLAHAPPETKWAAIYNKAQ
jgi:hypothetical protein